MYLRHDIAFVRDKLSAATALFHGYLRQVPRLGLIAATTIFIGEASTRKPLAQLVKPFASERLSLRPAGYHHSITLRRLGTDIAVLRQMLVIQEYQPVAALRNVRLIVDCGANIGMSAYYLLHCYPNARLIAIEPDAENLALCRENLSGFADRVCVIHGAVWPENRLLRVVPSSRELGSWAFRVEPWEKGDLEGLTIPEILRRAGEPGPIDLLKMDIEGAEEEIFRASPSWLDVTRNIAIELHGKAAEASFQHALANHEYESRHVGELTVIYGLRRPAATRRS